MDSSSDGVRLDYTDGRCSLTIDRVRVEHEAEYVCTATNQHGSASTWAELLVESSYIPLAYCLSSCLTDSARFAIFKSRLHDTTCCQTGCQQSVGQPGKCLYTRYNRLSNPLSNRIDNRLYRVYKHSTGCKTRLTTGLTNCCIVYTAGCQSGCTTRFDNRLDACLHDTAGCQTGCTTGCIV